MESFCFTMAQVVRFGFLSFFFFFKLSNCFIIIKIKLIWVAFLFLKYFCNPISDNEQEERRCCITSEVPCPDSENSCFPYNDCSPPRAGAAAWCAVWGAGTADLEGCSGRQVAYPVPAFSLFTKWLECWIFFPLGWTL